MTGRLDIGLECTLSYDIDVLLTWVNQLIWYSNQAMTILIGVQLHKLITIEATAWESVPGGP